MRRFMILAILGVSLFMLFAAGIAHADDGGDKVTLSTSPTVTVSLSNNTSVNVTYSDIFVGMSTGVVGASFADQSWNITNTSSGYAYKASFDLTPIGGSDLSDQYRSIMNLSDNTTVGGDSTLSLPVTVIVKVSHYNGSVSELSVKNLTSMLNGTISNVSLSTLKLSFGISFDLTQQMIGNGSVNVVLVQTLKGGDQSSSFSSKEVDTYEKTSDLGQGIALLNNSITNLSAVYWWNNDFSYNGINGTDYTVLVPGDGSTSIAFVFKTQAASGQYSLSQDPYLSVNGANLINGKIQVVTQALASFFLQHVEFFGAGVAVGSVTLIVLYSIYKRDRIKI